MRGRGWDGKSAEAVYAYADGDSPGSTLSILPRFSTNSDQLQIHYAAQVQNVQDNTLNYNMFDSLIRQLSIFAAGY